MTIYSPTAPGGGGGGGLAFVTTDDTADVDFSGDGTPGTPLEALFTVPMATQAELDAVALTSAPATAKGPALPSLAGVRQLGVPGLRLTSISTSVLAINTDYYAWFYVDAPITLTDYFFRVTAAPASNALVRNGIYPADNDLQPLAAAAPLLNSEVAVASGFVGVKTIGPFAVVLARGWYLQVLNCDVGMTLQAWRGDGFITPAVDGTSLIANATVARAYAPFPTPGTAWTALVGSGNGIRPLTAYRW